MAMLEPESAIWSAVCWLVVIARLASRRIHRGAWKLLQWDDYLAVAAMLTDTVLLIVMHEIVKSSSNLIAPGEDVSTFSEAEIQRRVHGSKLVLVVEQMQIITIWLMKACLLLLYYRMTQLLSQHKFVIATAIYVAVGFVVMEILYLGVWCRPFTQYWQVPPENPQCSAATNHLITNAVLNISSDVLIISIPLPLLLKVNIPKKNKMVLVAIFCIGIFSIVAAVLNKYYSFTHPFGEEWTIWYLRESFTAILCANLPLTYPLLQRAFKLKSWSYQSYGGTYRHTTSFGRQNASAGPNPHLQSVPQSYSGARKSWKSHKGSERGLTCKPKRNDSTEFITSAIELEETTSIPKQASSNTPSTIGRGGSAEIKEKEVDVESRPGDKEVGVHEHF